MEYKITGKAFIGFAVALRAILAGRRVVFLQQELSVERLKKKVERFERRKQAGK